MNNRPDWANGGPAGAKPPVSGALPATAKPTSPKTRTSIASGVLLDTAVALRWILGATARRGVRRLAFAVGPGRFPGRAEPRFGTESGSKLPHSPWRSPSGARHGLLSGITRATPPAATSIKTGRPIVRREDRAAGSPRTVSDPPTSSALAPLPFKWKPMVATGPTCGHRAESAFSLATDRCDASRKQVTSHALPRDSTRTSSA
jgi:hypothetical protein